MSYLNRWTVVSRAQRVAIARNESPILTFVCPHLLITGYAATVCKRSVLKRRGLRGV
jgi:hypothetical protein